MSSDRHHPTAVDALRRRLERFYERHNADNLTKIERIMAAYDYDPDDIFRDLVEMYGPEGDNIPTAAAGATRAAAAVGGGDATVIGAASIHPEPPSLPSSPPSLSSGTAPSHTLDQHQPQEEEEKGDSDHINTDAGGISHSPVNGRTMIASHDSTGDQSRSSPAVMSGGEDSPAQSLPWTVLSPPSAATARALVGGPPAASDPATNPQPERPQLLPEDEHNGAATAADEEPMQEDNTGAAAVSAAAATITTNANPTTLTVPATSLERIMAEAAAEVQDIETRARGPTSTPAISATIKTSKQAATSTPTPATTSNSGSNRTDKGVRFDALLPQGSDPSASSGSGAAVKGFELQGAELFNYKELPTRKERKAKEKEAMMKRSASPPKEVEHVVGADARVQPSITAQSRPPPLLPLPDTGVTDHAGGGAGGVNKNMPSADGGGTIPTSAPLGATTGGRSTTAFAVSPALQALQTRWGQPQPQPQPQPQQHTDTNSGQSSDGRRRGDGDKEEEVIAWAQNSGAGGGGGDGADRRTTFSVASTDVGGDHISIGNNHSMRWSSSHHLQDGSEGVDRSRSPVPVVPPAYAAAAAVEAATTTPSGRNEEYLQPHSALLQQHQQRGRETYRNTQNDDGYAISSEVPAHTQSATANHHHHHHHTHHTHGHNNAPQHHNHHPRRLDVASGEVSESSCYALSAASDDDEHPQPTTMSQQQQRPSAPATTQLLTGATAGPSRDFRPPAAAAADTTGVVSAGGGVGGGPQRAVDDHFSRNLAAAALQQQHHGQQSSAASPAAVAIGVTTAVTVATAMAGLVASPPAAVHQRLAAAEPPRSAPEGRTGAVDRGEQVQHNQQLLHGPPERLVAVLMNRALQEAQQHSKSRTLDESTRTILQQRRPVNGGGGGALRNSSSSPPRALNPIDSGEYEHLRNGSVSGGGYGDDGGVGVEMPPWLQQQPPALQRSQSFERTYSVSSSVLRQQQPPPPHHHHLAMSSAVPAAAPSSSPVRKAIRATTPECQSHQARRPSFVEKCATPIRTTDGAPPMTSRRGGSGPGGAAGGAAGAAASVVDVYDVAVTRAIALGAPSAVHRRTPADGGLFLTAAEAKRDGYQCANSLALLEAHERQRQQQSITTRGHLDRHDDQEEDLIGASWLPPEVVKVRLAASRPQPVAVLDKSTRHFVPYAPNGLLTAAVASAGNVAAPPLEHRQGGASQRSATSPSASTHRTMDRDEQPFLRGNVNNSNNIIFNHNTISAVSATSAASQHRAAGQQYMYDSSSNYQYIHQHNQPKNAAEEVVRLFQNFPPDAVYNNRHARTNNNNNHTVAVGMADANEDAQMPPHQTVPMPRSPFLTQVKKDRFFNERLVSGAAGPNNTSTGSFRLSNRQQDDGPQQTPAPQVMTTPSRNFSTIARGASVTGGRDPQLHSTRSTLSSPAAHQSQTPQPQPPILIRNNSNNSKYASGLQLSLSTMSGAQWLQTQAHHGGQTPQTQTPSRGGSNLNQISVVSVDRR